MNETDAAGQHIFDTVTGDVAVTALIGSRFYEQEGPEDAVYPFATYSLVPSTDVTQAGGDGRLLVNTRWLIQAFVDRRDPPAARAIASAIDAALEGSRGTVTLDGQAYHVQTVYRDNPVDGGGRVDGTYYSRAGGFYVAPVHAL